MMQSYFSLAFNWQDIGPSLINVVTEWAPRIGQFLIIIFIGYLLAVLTRWGLTSAVNKISFLKDGIKDLLGEDSSIDPGLIVGKLGYWLVLLISLATALESLQLTILSNPISMMIGKVLAFLPNFLLAIALSLFAWFLATAARKVLQRMFDVTTLDDVLAEKAGLEKSEGNPISSTLADVAYWFILFLFLPAILDTLKLQGLLEPINKLMEDLLTFLPNLFGAIITGVVGWFIAKMVSKIVTGLSSASGVDSLGEQIGLQDALGELKVSSILGTIAYIFVLVPSVIAALEQLNLDAITGPATGVLATFFATIPMLVSAGVVLIFAVILGKYVSELVANVLDNMGFNNVLQHLGLPEVDKNSEYVPSTIVGKLVNLTILLLAVLQASQFLGFDQMTYVFLRFTQFGSQIVMGLIVLGVGLFLANLASGWVANSGVNNAETLSSVARVAILTFTTAMALQEMGIASGIIQVAFSLILGAFCVAFAIAVGFGCKDIAKEQVEKLFKK